MREKVSHKDTKVDAKAQRYLNAFFVPLCEIALVLC